MGKISEKAKEKIYGLSSCVIAGLALIALIRLSFI